MKTDRRRVTNVFFLLAVGFVFSLSGCVSAPPEPVIAGDEESRDLPEAPIMASPDPGGVPVPVRIRHVPTVPHPDVVLEAPLPVSVLGSEALGIREYPKAYQEPPEITLVPAAPIRVTPLPAWSLPIPKAPATRLSRADSPVSQEIVDSDAIGDDPQQRSGSIEPTEPTGIPVQNRSADTAPRAPQSQSRTLTYRDPPEDTVAERTVEVGERFQISLPGRGWVYLGGGEELQFLDRTTEGADVVFSFRGASAGANTDQPSVLEFESQDFTTGSRSRHEEQILIAEADGQEGGEDPAPTDMRSGTEDGGEAPADVSGAGASAEELIQQLNQLQSSGRYEAAVDLLEGMRREAIGGDDEITFRLAQLYEAEWEGRDLLRARTLYRRVVENYPLSRWRGPARERIEYLNRHFFHIR